MAALKNILVIRLSAMGDVAITVPILKAFSEQYPEVKVTVLTRVLFTPFFRDIPNVTIHVADVNNKHKGVFGLYKLARELKKKKFDAVADLHNVLRSNILKPMIGVKRHVTIDKGRKQKQELVKGKLKQLKTTYQRYADVFETLGYKIDLSNPKFPKPATLSLTILELISHPHKKRIGIAPFAAHESKMYPLDLMEQVIEALSKSYQVLLFGGGKKEIQVLTYFESADKSVVNLAGKLSLDEELDVISNLDVMLSMDSGNAHLAAMLGIKTVTIWGVTHPYAGFAPFNQPEGYCLLADRNQYPKIPTSIYGNKYPEDYKNASGSISVESIVAKISAII